jgi:FixJ family two-component response regulator
LDSVVEQGSKVGIDVFLQKPVMATVLYENITTEIKNRKDNWHHLFNEKLKQVNRLKNNQVRTIS